MPAMAFMSAQKVENEAPARLLLFCSPLLLLPVPLLPPPMMPADIDTVEEVFFNTRLEASSEGCMWPLTANRFEVDAPAEGVLAADEAFAVRLILVKSRSS